MYNHINIVTARVYGLQDRIIVPLTREDTLNMVADELATLASLRDNTKDVHLPASVVSVRWGEHQVTKNIKKQFRGNRVQSVSYAQEYYLRRKFRWAIALTSVEWRGSPFIDLKFSKNLRSLHELQLSSC